MDITFPGQVQHAVSVAYSLVHGNLYLGPHAPVPAFAPCWPNFCFFSRIVTHKVKKTLRINPLREENYGYGEVAQQIDLYFRKELVCVVYVRGRKYDRNCSISKWWWKIDGISFIDEVGQQNTTGTWRYYYAGFCSLTACD